MSNNNMIPTNDEIKAIEIMVKHAVDSKFLEKIGGFPGAFTIAMYAREMGLPIMTSLFGGIRPVLGKWEISPQMMNAMIRKAGHSLQTKEHSNDICTIYGKRKDSGEHMTVSFSIADAKQANIYKGAWITYPKNMVYKSALSNLAKWLFPDVIGMSYVEDEIQESSLRNDRQQAPEMIEADVSTGEVLKIEQKAAEPEYISEEQMNEILTLIGDDSKLYENVMKAYGIKTFLKLPKDKFESVVKRLNITLEEKKKNNENT